MSDETPAPQKVEKGAESGAERGAERAALLALPGEERGRPLRAILARLAAQALRVTTFEVPVDRPLSALGLDSLGAIELCNGIEAALGVPVAMARLLAGASLEELATEVLARLGEPLAAGGAEVPAEAPETAEAAEVPLSHGQRALWLIERLAPGNPAYVLAGAVKVRGALDPAALRQRLAVLARRHAALRTTFHETVEGPVQRVAAPALAAPGQEAPVEVYQEDASGWSGEELPERLADAASRPFDLAAGPLLRVGTYRLAEGEWALVLSIHHLVSDFWSLGILLAELRLLLADPGAASALPPAPAYAEHVRREAERLAGPEGERLWSFWHRELAGGGAALDLPVDRPRPRLQTFRGGSQGGALPAATWGALKALGREHGATPFMALLAAWQGLLARWSGQDEVRVGTPTAGRSSPDLAGAVGYFVNPVVLRGDLSGAPAFSDLLAATRRRVLAAFAHQEYPFALLAERLEPQRDPGKSPLFQALLVLQKERSAGERGLAALAVRRGGVALSLGGLAAETLPLPARGAQFDVTLVAAELAGELALTIEHNDLFDGATAQRLLSHLASLAAAAAAAPEARLLDLPLLAPAERHQTLVEWSDTGAVHSADTLHGLFERQAAATPEANALVFAEAVEESGAGGAERLERVLSYGELARRSGVIAAHLRSLGVRPEVRVGIGLERTPDLVISLLGVLRAGGAYVPLDPAYPAERLHFTIADSAMPVLLTRPHLAALLPPHGARVVDVAAVLAGPAAAREGKTAAAGPRNLAYVIYTSGSTGRPKGVAIEHASAVALLSWGRGIFPPEDLAGVLFATSVCFDLSVFEMFVPLTRGGTVVLADNALELPRLPAAHGVTLVNTVPSVMAELVRANAVPASVRTVNLAGESLPRSLADGIYAVPTVARLLDLYGPSEDTTYSTIAVVPRAGRRMPAIGRPLGGTRLYLLDRGFAPVPTGVPGEIALGGQGLARGYLARPALTAERFVPDPFAGRLGGAPGDRLYRTGDLGRFRADGEIEFLGRIDHQVKIRGFRIELGEIEAVLDEHPRLADAVVVARERHGAAGSAVLVAYVVPAGAVGLAERRELASEMRAYLRTRLPEVMVPSAVEVLGALPRTPNSKVDRQALPTPRWEGSAERHTEPRGADEEAVAAIWREVLGAERVGAFDDFFALGGHSLSGTRVLARLREALGVELPLRALFEAPTVADLAAAAAMARSASVEAGAEVAGTSAGAIPRLPAGAARPPSFAQERLWFLDQLEAGESSTYNVPGLVRLRGRLDVRALAAGLSEIVRRHEVLRTRYVAPAGQPLPAVDPPGGHLPFAVADLAALPRAAAEQELASLASQEARRPFDLASQPPLRALLLRLPGDEAGTGEEHALALTLHHVAADGWSLGVLLAELSALYPHFAAREPLGGAFAAGRPSPLPELPIQYADYAAWQRAWLAGGALAAQLAWWREHLAGAPQGLDLPTDRPRPAVQRFHGSHVRFLLPARLATRLEVLGREEGATLFMVLAAGLAALLGRCARVDDLLLGSPVANRVRIEVEGLVGCFVNTLVLRADLGGEPSFRDLVGRLREASLGAFAHADVPFEAVVEALAPERSLGRSPLVQVTFALQTAPAAPLALPGLAAELVRTDTGTAKLDLALELTPGPRGLEGWIELDRDLFDEATIARLAGQLENLLARAVAAPEADVWEIPLAAPGEAHQMLREGRGRPEPRERAGPASAGARLELRPEVEKGRRRPLLAVAPRTPVEEIVAGVWARVLEREHVSVHDDFFDLGGHSLLVTRVLSGLRQALGVELSIRQFFATPTVAGLARRIERAAGSAAAPPLLPVARAGPLPLSFAQERLWFLEQLAPGGAAYHIPSARRLAGPLHTAVLAASLEAIHRRHEALRTRLVALGGRAVQVIDEPGEVPLPVVDLSALPAALAERAALAVAAAEARRPFDLAADPLLRSLLLRLAPEGHLLAVILHHAVADAWSAGIVVQELAALYDGLLARRPPLLPALPVQYVDYAVGQRGWLVGEALEIRLASWRERLAGAPALLKLPTDRPRPPVQTLAGAQQPVRLPAELTGRLKIAARERGATLFMALLAGFQALLARLSGQEDVLVGSPVAGRDRAETEPLIGFFVNTVVLRLTLDGRPGFGDLVVRARRSALDAFTHADLPFELLVDALQPERDLSHAPLFQVMLALQTVPPATLRLAGLDCEEVPLETGTSKLDLLLGLTESRGELVGMLEHSTDLFDPATVLRLAGHLETLLAAALTEPERAWTELPLLAEPERFQVLAEWNDSAGSYEGDAYGSDVTLTSLFERQAARAPLAPAVEHEGRTLTYGELDREANRLAHRLRALGVGPDVPVALYLERSVEGVVGIVGALKAGGAYLPLDPGYPRERVLTMLADAGRPVAVSTPALAGQVADLAADVVLLDAAGAGQEGLSGEAPAVPATAANLAYVLYTSGSTGRPKGVACSHRGVVNLLAELERRKPLVAGAGSSLWASLSFDVSVYEIFSALTTGDVVQVVPEAVRADSWAFFRWLEARGTANAFVPPFMVADLCAHLEKGAGSLALARLMVGVEPIPEASLAKIARALSGLPGAAVINGYGPTEATVCATLYEVDPGICHASNTPIGQAVANASIHLLDRDLQPVPAGVTGEIHIGGQGLARGYFGCPDATAERFMPDPFGGVGDRLYRTGDLARRRWDGNVEFLGRIDHQVKLRGFRIELGEIAVVLAAHPAVREAVAVVAGTEGHDRRLVAYLAVHGEPAPETQALRAFVAERLPEYMVPAAFVVLPSLPLSPNGKIDRQALARLEPPRPGEGEPTPPRTAVESLLAQIWADVLGIARQGGRVGIHDNFFELGGNSILSIQIVARAGQAGCRITPRQLFEQQTVARLAAVAGTAAAAEAHQGEVVGEVEPTPIQRWFFEQGFAAPHHFNQAVLLRVAGPLPPAAAEGAVAALLRHHDALRLRVEIREGAWGLRNAGIAEAGTPAFSRLDLSALGDLAVPALELSAAAVQASLDLAAGPLVRAVWFDLPGGERRLLLVIHHLVVDGVSWRILLGDLDTAARQLARGGAPAQAGGLPAKTTSYQRWVERLAEHARTQSPEPELATWLALGKHPPLPLSVDRRAGANTVASERRVAVALTEEETAALLREVPAAFGTQIDDALLTALTLTLARPDGTLLVDLEGHGREDLFEGVDLSRTVGWFTTLYPVLLHLGRHSKPAAALRQVQATLSAVPRRGIGYGLLRYLRGDERVASHLRALPRAEISFNYLGEFDQTFAEGALFAPAAEDSGTAQSPAQLRAHLLAVNALVAGGRLRLNWSFSDSFHRQATVERLAGTYLDHLRQLIASCRTAEEAPPPLSPAGLGSLREGELERVLAELGEAL